MPPARTVEDILKETKIHQILRPKLVMTLPSTPVKDVLALMQAERAGYAVIADEHSKVVGMFTEREVLMNVMKKGVAMADPVSKYMRKDVHTLTKGDTVGAALQAMNDFGIRHIPLVDEFSQVCGILSIRTIVTFLSELFPTEVFNIPPRPQIPQTAEGG
ncbi:MAG TPA: CBS domain-containing protein [Candidatus Eisenbacteria bacterium]|nr:CBS domain-containing protein [Candidatus Eisenbacteria bacterium]